MNKMFKYLKHLISVALLYISADFSSVYYGDVNYGMTAHLFGMISIAVVYLFYVPKTKEAEVFGMTMTTFLMFTLSSITDNPLVTLTAIILSFISIWRFVGLGNTVLWKGLPPILFCTVYLCFTIFLMITYETGAVGVFLTFLVGVIQAYQLIYIDKLNKELYRLLSAVLFMAMVSCNGGLPGLIFIMPISLLPLCNVVIYECVKVKDNQRIGMMI